MRVPKLAGGPDPENRSTGSGGAPKFYKNWLAFACSPYDPDHIPDTFGRPKGLRGPPLTRSYLATLLNAWEKAYFLPNRNESIRNKNQKALNKNKKRKKKEIKILYIMRVPKLAGGPDPENRS